MNKAFVLGAGLGTRLKTLTAEIPKPLVPVFQKPLITYAFDHLLDAGFKDFIINTHHRADAYRRAFPDARYRNAPLAFRHEPQLLETAGGIANIHDLVPDQPLLVYNGDILTDLPLGPLLDTHLRDGNLVTLALRSSGPSLHIAWDPATSKVLDIHDLLRTGAPGAFQFTGIYTVDPRFFSFLTPGKKESVIPIFLRLIQEENALGGVVIDDGAWWDLGDRDAYLAATASLEETGFPRYGRQPEQLRIHPGARIDPGADVCPHTVVGDGAVVEARVTLEQCALWPSARVSSGSTLKRCIVRHNAVASGDWTDADF